MSDVISHQEQGNHGVFFMERQGVRVAEMTYQRLGESRILVDHTQVDVSLRGKGVARMLFDAMIAWARQTDTKVSATCSYVIAQFAKDASIHDVMG